LSSSRRRRRDSWLHDLVRVDGFLGAGPHEMLVLLARIDVGGLNGRVQSPFGSIRTDSAGQHREIKSSGR
jgi:hypothetical protein